MDMLDLIALTGLEWLYDIIEERFGRTAASLIIIVLALLILGTVAWILMNVLKH